MVVSLLFQTFTCHRPFGFLRFAQRIWSPEVPHAKKIHFGNRDLKGDVFQQKIHRKNPGQIDKNSREGWGIRRKSKDSLRKKNEKLQAMIQTIGEKKQPSILVRDSFNQKNRKSHHPSPNVQIDLAQILFKSPAKINGWSSPISAVSSRSNNQAWQPCIMLGLG